MVSKDATIIGNYTVYISNNVTLFPSTILDPARLVESMDAEPMDKKGGL